MTTLRYACCDATADAPAPAGLGRPADLTAPVALAARAAAGAPATARRAVAAVPWLDVALWALLLAVGIGLVVAFAALDFWLVPDIV